jgi:hypothetical protein
VFIPIQKFKLPPCQDNKDIFGISKKWPLA